MKFEFGVEVKDKISGFVGIIAGRVEYITGCNQYLLTPKCGKDNIKKENHWLDEGRLELVKKKKISLKKSANKNIGFDTPAFNKS